MQSQIINKWYYRPDNKWFSNRKEVKEYLGSVSLFRREFKLKNVIFIPGV